MEHLQATAPPRGLISKLALEYLTIVLNTISLIEAMNILYLFFLLNLWQNWSIFTEAGHLLFFWVDKADIDLL